jgi:hypothetical protein
MELMIVVLVTRLAEATGVGAADEYAMRSAAAAEWQSYWAAWAVGASATSLIVSGVALYFLFRSLQQTQEALDVTKDLGHRQTRAYVEATTVTFSMDDDGDLVVRCQNSGETPSPMVAVGVEAVRLPSGNIAHLLKANRPPSPPRKTWTAIGARGTLRAKVTPLKGHSAVAEFRAGGFGLNERLLVVGTIIYQDIFSQYFRTEFAFFSTSPKDGFLRPNGLLAAYEPVSQQEVESLLQLDPRPLLQN